MLCCPLRWSGFSRPLPLEFTSMDACRTVRRLIPIPGARGASRMRGRLGLGSSTPQMRFVHPGRPALGPTRHIQSNSWLADGSGIGLRWSRLCVPHLLEVASRDVCRIGRDPVVRSAAGRAVRRFPPRLAPHRNGSSHRESVIHPPCLPSVRRLSFQHGAHWAWRRKCDPGEGGN